MGITMGDALTVMGLFAGLGLSSWAAMIVAALLFPSRAEVAQAAIVKPGRTVGLGLATGFVGIGFSLVLLSVPQPLAKLIGFAGLGTMLCIAAVGGAGLSRLLMTRIHAIDPSWGPFPSLARASTLVVLMGLLPIIGWFLLGPAMFVLMIGAGTRSLFRGKPAAQATAPPVY
ncbi:MAG: hypothetical protein JNM85_02795 [Chthonomonas sp.]|nr:hypothetical protein [Chthonomonas sp.]